MSRAMGRPILHPARRKAATVAEMLRNIPPIVEDALLTEVDAADLLRLSVRTLQAWRARGFGPTFVRAGRAIRYRRCDLKEWVNANLVVANSKSAA
jgi:hypothetical protein